jgi:hypothetical protein
MLKGLERGEIRKGDVVIIRYEGPKGGPGMPEMLTPTSAIMGAGLGKDVALIRRRFSGGSQFTSATWCLKRRKADHRVAARWRRSPWMPRGTIRVSPGAMSK